ncbi:MAG: hypothetical protein KY475_15000 [Planctomycetes bacterium]|nr:hypothetical protein [Planctomycetota bacterium]
MNDRTITLPTWLFLVLMAVPLSMAARALADSPADEEAAAPAAGEDALEAPRVVYPENRPEWVEAPPAKEGEIDRIAVTSGPHYSLGEARRQLEEAVRQATDDYVNRHLGAAGATRYLHYNVAPVETFEERPEFSFGPMHQAHALLEFDEAFRRQAEADWKEALTLSRLVRTGLIGGAVFILLAVLLGYLRADNATRGFYTRRLRLGAATVILALAAVVYFAVRTIPWI